MMDNWQDWMVMVVVCWGAVVVIREFIKPFKGNTCNGCDSVCQKQSGQTRLIVIEH